MPKREEQDIKLELENVLTKLSVRSKDSIVNKEHFSEFNKYMHIHRPIQDELENHIKNFLLKSERKSIVFIVGNVGDGKSHILSYMVDKYSKELDENDVIIHNDATETNSPKKTAIETLMELLKPFNDMRLERRKVEKLIIAINLGVLTKLVEKLKENKGFAKLVNYIEETGILNQYNIREVDNKNFKITSFIGQSNIGIDGEKITSKFYEEALKKVYSKEENLFYRAFIRDGIRGVKNQTHRNYEMLLKPEVQKSIVHILIRAEIEHKIIISARTLFNFFHDITLAKKSKDKFKSTLTYLLFENFDKSELLNIISQLDPIKNNTKKVDEIAIKIYHSENYREKVFELLGEENRYSFYNFPQIKKKKEEFKEYLKTYLRIKFLLNYQDDLFHNDTYLEYIDIYVSIMNSQKDKKYRDKRLIKLVDETYSKWNGDFGHNSKIVKNRFNPKIKLLITANPKPIDQKVVGSEIVMEYMVNKEIVMLVLDYNNFNILNKVKNGYLLKSDDRKKSVNFERFLNQVIKSAEKDSQEIEIYHLDLGERFELRKEAWGEYSLERIR